MQFKAQEDIGAPIDVVYDTLTDFRTFENAALRRGAEIERLDDGEGPVVGARWRVRFRLRGRDRVVDAELTELAAPESYVIESTGGGIDGVSRIGLVALSKSSTRLSIEINLSPRTLSARLILQSVRLARSTLARRFKHRIADFAEDVEQRYRLGS